MPVAAAAGPDARRGTEPEPESEAARPWTEETGWADPAPDAPALHAQERPSREAALLGEAALVAAALIGAGTGRTPGEEAPPETDPVPPGPEEPAETAETAETAEAADAEEDFAAWDRTDDSFVPLLLSTAVQEEDGDGPAARFSREDEETWTGAPGTRTAEPAPSGLVTWQPSRRQPPGEGAPSGLGLPVGGLMCADVPYDPDLDEQDEEEGGQGEDDERKPAAVSAADLLVQDNGVWGAPDDTDNGFL
ncbi:hypothetical protein ABT404_30000 [Streptomyces hyaluromycini]|uniref:Uncharacterized protein n=1 Tax=Streptomyces hyaluromycini TaxID=1377993 RepID=A0ABV1X3S6_9ACTN